MEMKLKCDSCNKTIKTTSDAHHMSIGICGHTGASTETLSTLLMDWHVCVYVDDGRHLWGVLVGDNDVEITLSVKDDSGNETHTETVNWNNVVHIQVG